MSLDQKVGQLYSVWTASKYGQEEINEIKRIINEYHIGGLIFSLGNINDQIISHNIFQEQSNIPLGFIALNTTLGLGEIDAVRATIDDDEIGDFLGA